MNLTMGSRQESMRTPSGAISRNGAFGLFVAGAVFALLPLLAQGQVDESKRASLQSQLEALEREAAEIDERIAATQEEARTLEQQIKIFNDEIKRR